MAALGIIYIYIYIYTHTHHGFNYQGFEGGLLIRASPSVAWTSVVSTSNSSF